MKIEIVMPKMGESLTEGTILKWLKKPGDKIERDEMILEISTDKVDTEVPSPSEGILTQILAQENETVDVGKVIAIIETEPGKSEVVTQPPATQSAIQPSATSKPAPEPTKPVQHVPPTQQEPVASQPVAKTPLQGLTDIVMPKMGESLQEGTITKWLKKVGDKVERDEMIFEISTDKVDTEVPSPVAGTLAEILFGENTTLEVGTVIARIATGEIPPKAAPIKQPEAAVQATAQPTPAVTQPAAAPSMPVKAVLTEKRTMEIPRMSGNRFYSPLVRSIAEANEISLEELDTIMGHGVDGRVNKQDVLDYLKQRGLVKPVVEIPAKEETQTTPVVPPVPATVTQPVPIPSSPVQVPAAEAKVQTPLQAAKPPAIYGEEHEVIPMDRVRQLISEHMTFSTHTSAHVTSVGEVDVTDIVHLINKHKDDFLKREGIKLTYTPFICRGIIDGVKAYPMVNVSVDGHNIIRHKRINLGIATALEDGNLIVPVIKDADSLSMSGLARSVYDLSMKARTKKLNPDDIIGGTITLTNFGTFSTLFGTPIINQPQAAIIGMGAVQKRAVVREYEGEDVIVIRSMMYLSITFDHRVIDGALGGKCLGAIIKSLEAMNEGNVDM